MWAIGSVGCGLLRSSRAEFGAPLTLDVTKDFVNFLVGGTPMLREANQPHTAFVRGHR